jgi:hypothetical protein
MKISGLVSIFNQVRSRLQAGLSPAEVEPFRRQVRKVVTDVEEICRRNGKGIDHLPGPSRRAYLYLRDLDLDHLPMREGDSARPAAQGIRIKNVVKIGEQIADRLWLQLDSLLESTALRAGVGAEIHRQATAIEKVCRDHGTAPASLETPSRSMYCWLKYISTQEQFDWHLAALRQAREQAKTFPELAKHRLLLRLTNISSLWSRRAYRNALLLKVHQGFQGADSVVWKSLLQESLVGRSAAAARIYREFADTEDFSGVIFDMESLAQPPAPPLRGRVHDLGESFARINATYFDNTMSRPNLVWNRTLTARKFGHYQPSRDTVMISVTLDDPAISQLAIDFVMYHELLHKKHGTAFIDGRRQSHSPAFRAEEQRYAGYQIATDQLKQMALKQYGMLEAGPDLEEDPE